METSRKYGFNLPSRDGDDIADINLIADNFRITEDELGSLDERVNSNAENIKASNVQLQNVTGMVENAVIVAGEALASANMAQETANSADTTAIEAYERSISAEKKAEDASEQVEMLSSLTKKEMLNSELFLSILGSNERQTSFSIYHDDAINVKFEANKKYVVSIPVDKYGTGTIKLSERVISFDLNHNGNEYVCLYEPKENIEITEFYELFVYGEGAANFPQDINVIIQETTAIIEKFGEIDLKTDDIETAIDRLSTISDDELIVYPTLYNNDAPDWVEHDSSSFDPYMPGKELYFKADIKQGKTYLVRVYIEHQEGYKGPQIMLTKKNSGSPVGRIDDYKLAVYNEEVGCYQAEFTAKRSTEKGEELTLYVEYPGDSTTGYDYSAVFGGARIYLKDSLRGVIDSQNEEIAQIGGDIEAALDGIITIQNELIGGGNV